MLREEPIDTGSQYKTLISIAVSLRRPRFPGQIAAEHANYGYILLNVVQENIPTLCWEHYRK